MNSGSSTPKPDEAVVVVVGDGTIDGGCGLCDGTADCCVGSGCALRIIGLYSISSLAESRDVAITIR